MSKRLQNIVFVASLVIHYIIVYVSEVEVSGSQRVARFQGTCGLSWTLLDNTLFCATVQKRNCSQTNMSRTIVDLFLVIFLSRACPEPSRHGPAPPRPVLEPGVAL